MPGNPALELLVTRSLLYEALGAAGGCVISKTHFAPVPAIKGRATLSVLDAESDRAASRTHGVRCR